MKSKRFLAVALTVAAVLSGAVCSFAAELVVYSARNEQLIKPLMDAYTKETGTTFKFITDKEGPLMERLKAEGANSPSDLLITVDAGNLWQAANEGLLQPVQSKVLAQNVPPFLRDAQNHWFGLSLRARTIVYSTERVKPETLSTYEALGEPAWKGRLVLRTSKKVYNQSLVAMMIAEHGEAKTEQIVRSWVANLATAPASSDNQVMEFIAAGKGDVGIVNTYYFGRLLKEKPELQGKLALFWPNQKLDKSGVHVNVSGAGVTKYAKNKEEAVRFIEWLSSEKGQNIFADSNLEFPVNPAVKPHAEVAAWGEFKKSPFNLTQAGSLQDAAIKLMDRSEYR